MTENPNYFDIYFKSPEGNQGCLCAVKAPSLLQALNEALTKLNYVSEWTADDFTLLGAIPSKSIPTQK